MYTNMKVRSYLIITFELLERFSIECRKQTSTNHNRCKQHNEPIGFSFPSHWLINWRENFKPITKRSNCNREVTFYSHLKTALCEKKLLYNKKQ